MGVWTDQAVAIVAEFMEMGATVAVSLGWAAARVMDPLWRMATGLRDRASADLESDNNGGGADMGDGVGGMGLVTGRPSLVGAGFMGQGARAGMLQMEQVVTSAVSAEPGWRETTPW